MNLLFLRSLRVSLSEIIEMMNVKTNAKIQSQIESDENAFVVVGERNSLISSNAKPPTMIGILNRKLYSADFSSLFPARMSDEIVLPDLEIPGKTAIP